MYPCVSLLMRCQFNSPGILHRTKSLARESHAEQSPTWLSRRGVDLELPEICPARKINPRAAGATSCVDLTEDIDDGVLGSCLPPRRVILELTIRQGGRSLEKRGILN
jgi:hypothetical protein